jgi:molybdate transport system ATP-binding protein
VAGHPAGKPFLEEQFGLAHPMMLSVIDARIRKQLPGKRGESPFTLDIHLHSEGGVTALLGPSGAGKTLTLRCLAGFTHPDEGRILVDDQLYFDAAAKLHLSPQKRRCGYIFQDDALFPHMSVRQNLNFAIQSSHSPRPGRIESHRRVNELLERFELDSLSERNPHQLSGGQKQRASIARALVGRPRFLLLDEPTTGLDYRLRANFYELLRQVKDMHEVPMVLVTHELDECFELADSVCFIDHGRILQSGLKEQVIARPASLDVARLFDIYAILPSEIVMLDPGNNISRLRIAGQELEGPYLRGHLIGDNGWLCVRRQELRILPRVTKKAESQVILTIKRTLQVARGVRLEFESGVSADISESQFAELRGSRDVTVEIPKSAVHFLSK